MTGSDPNSADVTIDMKGDAVETAKELAKEFENAADKQDELIKGAERYARVMASLRRQQSREQQRQDREDEAAVKRRSRVMASLGRQREQEENRTKREAAQKRSRVLGSLGQQRQEEERADREKEQAVKRRSRVMASLGRQKEQEEKRRALERENRPLTEMQEAGQRILAGEKEDRVKRLMNQMKGRPEGLAGIVHGAENVLGLEDSRPLSAMYAKAKGLVGPVGGAALLATAGKFALGGSLTVSDHMQHGSPYQDEFSRTRDVYNNLPFGKEFFGIRDLVLGRSQAINRVNKAKIAADARSPIEFESFLTRADLEQDRRAAQLDALSVRKNPLPGFPGGDRRTVGQQQQYQLAQRLLPLQEQLTEASTTRAEAENQVTAAQEKQKKLADERKKVYDRRELTIEGSKRLNLQSGDPEYMRRANAVELDTNRLVELDRQEISGQMNLKQRELQATQARRAEAMASIAMG